MEDGDQIDAMVEQQGGGEEASDQHINVKVTSGDQEVFFRIKKTTPVLMN
jgi:hypothetical protein